MFEPAAVRTLLDLRSSLPSRPATAYLAGYPSAPSLGLSSSSAVADTLERRPLTAPAACGEILGRLPKPAVELIAEEDEREEEEEDCDPSDLLARASTTLYQLKHTWAEERQSEIRALWDQLEEQYDVTVPLEALTAVDAEASEAQTADREYADEEAELARVADEAASQLETARALRLTVEQRLCNEKVRREDFGRPSALALAPETDDRLDELRDDLVRLRARSEQVVAPMVEVQDIPLDEPAPHEVGVGMSALERWMDDVRALASQPSTRPPSALNRPPASPLRGRGGRTPVERVLESDPRTALEEVAPVSDLESKLDELLDGLDEIDQIHSRLTRRLVDGDRR